MTEQKKEINKAFPEGYGTNMTQIITPNGETLDALIWETEEIIYLVKKECVSMVLAKISQLKKQDF